jgi:hypothetical protein
MQPLVQVPAGKCCAGWLSPVPQLGEGGATGGSPPSRGRQGAVHHHTPPLALSGTPPAKVYGWA